MVVRFRLALAWTLLGLGAFNLVLVGLLAGTGGRVPIGSVVAGIVCVFIGGLYFVRPYFRLVDGAFEVPALIGPLQRRFPFDEPEGVQYRDGRFWVTSAGQPKKVPVQRWMARPEDWRALVEHLHLAQLD
jgi:hypothetical protein